MWEKKGKRDNSSGLFESRIQFTIMLKDYIHEEVQRKVKTTDGKQALRTRAQNERLGSKLVYIQSCKLIFSYLC